MDKKVIRLKESSMCRFRPGFISNDWLKLVMSFPDAFGRTGYDAFKKHDIVLVSKNERADLGFAKGISKVKGIPRSKCVLWRGEPPIYDVYFGPMLRNKSYLDEHLGVMSYYKDEYDCVRISGPQNAFHYYNLYFRNVDRKLLCTVLTNKTISVFINGFIFHDTKNHSLMGYRRYMDRVFCDNFEEDYVSYGRGWDSRCFKGKLREWTDMFKVLGQHKFAFVPENSSYSGYVSDKIINAMCCGAIPIYSGAPDVEDYIPKNCMLLTANYSEKELIRKIKNMSFSEYFRYRNNIRKFLTSKKTNIYSSYCFAEKIANIIEENL